MSKTTNSRLHRGLFSCSRQPLDGATDLFVTLAAVCGCVCLRTCACACAYPGLPHQSVRVTVAQSLHDSLDCGSHFLRVGVTSVYNLQTAQGQSTAVSTVSISIRVRRSLES